ncbi:unnamed protein product [Arabis nemorensis]|uniref:Signal peptidase complex subunit 2 n=1 Tax=Arabis nemorensis TaxID=586526 RepID=A0A565C293_9BRAS|nr:unnamed protein product [Arabis nemorensis]
MKRRRNETSFDRNRLLPPTAKPKQNSLLHSAREFSKNPYSYRSAIFLTQIQSDMEAEKKTESTNTKNVKKVNLLDHNSVKHILDESVSEIVTSRGYKEDVRLSNLKLMLGAIIIVVALVAQFYKKKFPENRDFLIYVVLSAVMQLIMYTMEKNAILFTYPLEGSFTSTGLVVSSKLPRFSDQYTLRIESADPKSISAGKPVQLTKDGVLVEGLFWKDVEALIREYTGAEEPKKKR